jgi:hypothetical protein
VGSCFCLTGFTFFTSWIFSYKAFYPGVPATDTPGAGITGSGRSRAACRSCREQEYIPPLPVAFYPLPDTGLYYILHQQEYNGVFKNNPKKTV